MKAIETKYIGPSCVRGSRIKAFDGDNSITLSYDNGLNNEDNHKEAAIALCKKLGWHGSLQGGHTKKGMVWVWFDVDYMVLDADHMAKILKGDAECDTE
jgi:hypothetical protein